MSFIPMSEESFHKLECAKLYAHARSDTNQRRRSALVKAEDAVGGEDLLGAVDCAAILSWPRGWLGL